MDTSNLKFLEFTPDMVSGNAVNDLNRLLPQLVRGAQPITAEGLKSTIASGTRLFVATDNDRIIGTVLLCSMALLVGRQDWIEDVVVDESYRRQGVSSRLMEMAEQASAAGPATSLNLTSNRARADARQMYLRRGYEVRDSDLFRKPS
jgi:GNAT superfamily N-acetyltransferase